MANMIGTAPNQVPVNSMLGTLAYQNKEDVHLEKVLVDTQITMKSPNGTKYVLTVTDLGELQVDPVA